MKINNLDYIFKVSSILRKSDKRKLFLLNFLTIIRSVFELLSLGLIIPILAFLTNFDKTIIIINDKLPFLQSFEKIELIYFLILIFLPRSVSNLILSLIKLKGPCLISIISTSFKILKP